MHYAVSGWSYLSDSLRLYIPIRMYMCIRLLCQHKWHHSYTDSENSRWCLHNKRTDKHDILDEITISIYNHYFYPDIKVHFTTTKHQLRCRDLSNFDINHWASDAMESIWPIQIWISSFAMISFDIYENFVNVTALIRFSGLWSYLSGSLRRCIQ